MKPLKPKLEDPQSKPETKQENVFSCEICAKNFQHKGSYTDHLKTHANYDIKYECAECPCFFKNSGHLSVHIRQAHCDIALKKIIKCSVCHKTFATRQSMTEHKRNQHPTLQVIYKCKFCQKPYSSKNSLKWHINLNHNKDFKRSKCPYCPCDFKWPHHLKVHIRKAHIEKGHTPSDLLKNGLTSIRRKTNNCVVCEEKFEKKFDLMVHLKYVHKQELDIFKCCRCNAVFTLGNSLKLHLDEHRRNKTGFPDHECDQCYPTSAPKLFEIMEKPEPEVVDERTDIEKEVIDFELSLMENEDIRELIKYRLKHAKRPKRKRQTFNFKPEVHSDFDDFYETYVQNVDGKDDADSQDGAIKPESPIMNGKGKYYCEKCKLYFQMRFSYVTHLKDHTDTESQASTDTLEEKVDITDKITQDNFENNDVTKTEEVKDNRSLKTEEKSPKTKRRDIVKKKISERKTQMCAKAAKSDTKVNSPKKVTSTKHTEASIEDVTANKIDKAIKTDAKASPPKKVTSAKTTEATEGVTTKSNAIEKSNKTEARPSTPKKVTSAKTKDDSTAKAVGISNDIVNETSVVTEMLAEEIVTDTLDSDEDTKIDMEVRIKLARLSDKELNLMVYKCNLCEHTFALEANLEEHTRLSHGKNAEARVERKAANSRYKCDNCNQKFSSPLALNRHLRIESQKNKANNTKNKKKTVKKITQQKEVTYKCKICKTGFTDRKRYATHIRTNHREETPSSPQQSPKKSNVVQVMSPRLIRRQEKIYECGKCEIFFTSKLELLRHISDVHMRVTPRISSPKSHSTSE